MTSEIKVVPVSSKTSLIDPEKLWKQPREVSLEEVANAIVRLAKIDEGKIFSLASEGKLWTVFPYAATYPGVAEPEAWGDTKEAPGRALTDEEHARWLKE